jgi:hypothetical protein
VPDLTATQRMERILELLETRLDTAAGAYTLFTTMAYGE